MASPKQPEESLREELVAYLDGELSAAESESIERQIGQDDFAREELQKFDRVWNALDDLPRATVDDGFTKTTIEMAAIEAQKELAAETAMLPIRKRKRWLKMAGMTAAAVLVGFATLTLLTPNPNRQLYNNLPVIMQLDAYSEAHDIDFLRQLHDTCGTWLLEDWGPEIQTEVQALDKLTTASYSERVEYVDSLSTERRAELASQHHRYSSLSSEKQKELADWHETIAVDQEAEQLQKTMLAYYAWLSHINEREQAVLRAKPAAERVKQIEKMHERETLNNEYRLSPANARAIRDVLTKMEADPNMKRLYRQMIAAIPEPKDLPEDLPERLREGWEQGLARLKEMPPQVAMRMVMTFSGFSRMEGSLPKLEAYRQTVEEYRMAIESGMINALDDDSAERVRGMDEGQRRKLLTFWLMSALHQRPEKVDVATLEEFFLKGDLSEEDKAWLLSLPKEEMMFELESRYMEKYFGDQQDRDRINEAMQSFGGQSWGRGRGGRFGGGGRPNDDRGPRDGGPQGDERGPRNGNRGAGNDMGPRGEMGGGRGNGMGPPENGMGPREDQQFGPPRGRNSAPPEEGSPGANRPANRPASQPPATPPAAPAAGASTTP